MVGYVFKEKKKSKDKKETPTESCMALQVNDIGCQLNKMEFNSLFTG